MFNEVVAREKTAEKTTDHFHACVVAEHRGVHVARCQLEGKDFAEVPAPNGNLASFEVGDGAGLELEVPVEPGHNLLCCRCRFVHEFSG